MDLRQIREAGREHSIDSILYENEIRRNGVWYTRLSLSLPILPPRQYRTSFNVPVL